MIPPNRLSIPGETATHVRLEALFEGLDAGEIALPNPSPGDDRLEEARLEAERAADRAGRARLLEEAVAHVRETLLGRVGAEAGIFGASRLPEPAVVAARIAAIEDLVLAAVVEDIVDRETLAALRGLAGPAEETAAEAAAGAAPAAEDAWMTEPGGPVDPALNPGVRLSRDAAAVAAAVITTGALAVGLAVSQPLAGFLVGLVLGGLLLTIARGRPSR